LLVLDDCDPEFRGKAVYEDNLSLVDSSGKLRFRVSGFNGCQAIGSNHTVAVDPARKAIWVLEYAGERVRKLDFDGKELLRLDKVEANALAVDPETGHLWVATTTGKIYGQGTVVFSSEGKQLAEHDAGGWDIAYDTRGKRFWLAGKHLYKVSAKQLTPATPSTLLVRKDIAGWCSACLAINQKTGQVWVVSRQYIRGSGRNELLGFDNAGRPNVTVPLDEGEPRKFPFHASVDSKTGSVWVTVLRHGVRRYTAEGKLDGEFKFPALATQADEATGGAWVVTGEEILRVGAKGEVLRRLKHKRSTSQVWVTGF
jgi:sugar lactone lactonase YvrE